MELHNVIMTDQILSILKREFLQHAPFEEILLQFCEQLSKDFLHYPNVKLFPDLVALGYWLRKTHINELKSNFESLSGIRVPRGIAFHIPPSNVDTMFVYSWILSLLVGNANIIRLPTKQTPNTTILFAVIQKVLQEFPTIAEATQLISYGHEEEITQALSQQADIRIIWGGDATVEKIRKISMKPHAKEIVFPDRFSLSAIATEKYLSISTDAKISLAQKFFNDVYWFDQAACSSTRLMLWVGEKGDKASEEFYGYINDYLASKQHEIALSNVIMKKTFLTYQALNTPLKAVKTFSNELSVIELEKMSEEMRTHCGNGLLYDLKIDTLDEIIPYITHKDQTLSYFGFSAEELASFAKKLNGRGIDRMVPIGQSLNFDYIWDGYDLLQELSRIIVVV